MIPGDALLAGALRASKDAILAFEAVRDASGRIADFRRVVANPSAARLLSSQGGEWTGASLVRDPGPFQGADLMQAFIHLVESGVPVDRELTVSRSDGGRRLQLTAERAGDGFVAVVRDLAAQRELGSPGDHVLQAVFDAIPHPIFIKDRESRYVRVNRAMSDLWRMPAERIVGRKAIAPGERPEQELRSTADSDQDVMESGRPLDIVRTQTLPGGTVRRMRVKKAPIANDQGEVLGLVGMAEDITDRIQSEEALRRTEALLMTVINTLPHQIAAKDKEGRYTLVNRTWLGHFGLDSEEVLRHHASEIRRISAPYRQIIDTHDRYVLETGQALLNIDVVRTSAAGEARNFKLNKLPLFDAESRVDGLVSIAEDITDEKQTLAALRDSEQHFRDLVEGSLQGLAILQDNRIVFGNPAYLRMFGFASVEEAQQSGSVLDFVSPEDRERIRGYIRARRSGQPVAESYEAGLLRKDGSLFYVYMLARQVTWGGKLATQLVFYDSTDRRRAEQELRANQRLLQTVLDTLPHAVSVKDLQGRFLLVNAMKAAYHGLEPEALIGRTSEELPWPDERALAEGRRAEQDVLSSGRETTIDVIETQDAGGARRYGKLIQLPLVDEKGRLVGTVGISLDLTAEVTSRLEAEVAHAQLADAIESFPGGIVLYDADDRLALMNAKARDLWPEASVVDGAGAPFKAIARAALSEQGLAAEELKSRIEGMAGQQVQHIGLPLEVTRASGQRVQVLHHRMSRGGTIAVILDITETRRRDEELRQAQKMEAIGQLTGGIAHDFNNLLTVILGNSDFILETVRDAQAVACARMIAQAAQQGSALTQRLLSFARRQSLQPVELDLNRVVGSMEELIRRTLGEHIEIELIRGAGVWKTLADPSQLESALLNLAVNARDAMPGGGRLTIETANAWLDDAYASAHAEVRPGQYVMLSVTDTGTGMPRDIVERAFDPFFTTKQQGKGTGLGLSMVYGFVKQSGGHVKIYSEPGQGTSVKVYLPRHLGASQDSEPLQLPNDGPLPVGAETILVVEDDSLVRVNTMQQLTSLGYRVVAVEDARRALEMLERIERVHLLFTDVVMPGGMNGRQLADEAQRVWPGLKVLFASGYTPNAIVHHGRLDPGIQLISKPYRKTELARKVRRVLDM